MKARWGDGLVEVMIMVIIRLLGCRFWLQLEF